ncbi:hypothetical protein BDZ85DRAFT_266707, partial [Elsinoe ampelina]
MLILMPRLGLWSRGTTQFIPISRYHCEMMRLSSDHLYWPRTLLLYQDAKRLGAALHLTDFPCMPLEPRPSTLCSLSSLLYSSSREPPLVICEQTDFWFVSSNPELLLSPVPADRSYRAPHPHLSVSSKHPVEIIPFPLVVLYRRSSSSRYHRPSTHQWLLDHDSQTAGLVAQTVSLTSYLPFKLFSSSSSVFRPSVPIPGKARLPSGTVSHPCTRSRVAPHFHHHQKTYSASPQNGASTVSQREKLFSITHSHRPLSFHHLSAMCYSHPVVLGPSLPSPHRCVFEQCAAPRLGTQRGSLDISFCQVIARAVGFCVHIL